MTCRVFLSRLFASAWALILTRRAYGHAVIELQLRILTIQFEQLQKDVGVCTFTCREIIGRCCLKKDSAVLKIGG